MREEYLDFLSELHRDVVLLGVGDVVGSLAGIFVLLAADAIRQVQLNDQTFYRWRKQHGGMGTDQLEELERLQKENDRLRRAVSDLTLDNLILPEAARGNY